MNPIQSRLLRASATVLGLSAVLAAAASRLGVAAEVRLGLLTGLGLAAAGFLVGALSLAWASSRTDRVFYRAFFGGLLWKLAVVAGAFFFLAGRSAVHPASALVALAMATFLFNGVEILFLRKVKNGV